MDNTEKFLDEGGTFSIDYQQVMRTKDFQPSTRILAMDIADNGYCIVGDFFNTIKDDDLQKLLNISEDTESDAFSEIVLLAELLATGEGLDSFTSMEECAERTNQLIMFLACESLARKGLVRIFYENMSFGADAGDKMVVEKIV